MNRVISICKELKADQLTCRALWTSEDGTPQAEWIKENVTGLTHNFIKHFKEEEKHIQNVAQEEFYKGNISKRCYDAMMNYEVTITD